MTKVLEKGRFAFGDHELAMRFTEIQAFPACSCMGSCSIRL
jgi:hypothetical protein